MRPVFVVRTWSESRKPLGHLVVRGFQSLQDFINAMYQDEAGHLAAALGYIKGTGLMPALKRLDWPVVASCYNGPG